MIEEANLELIQMTELQDEVLRKIIKIMKEIDVKDPSKEKEMATLFEDSLDIMEFKLALENKFFDSPKPLIISEIDMKNIMKMTVIELAMYINQEIYGLQV